MKLYISVSDVVDAAISEDAQEIAISSYQGVHMEYFKYMVAFLKENKSSHINVFIDRTSSMIIFLVEITINNLTI